MEQDNANRPSFLLIHEPCDFNFFAYKRPQNIFQENN